MSKQAVIRVAEEQDVPQILGIYAPYILKSAVSFEITVPSEKEMWERILAIIRNYPYLVCEIGNRIAGYAYASEHRHREAYRWSKEVSVYVHPEFRGKHIACALYSVLFEILKFQGITNLLAGVTIPNPASIRFHEKLGFSKIGEYTAVGYKQGKWHNVGWWELNFNPRMEPPAEKIVPFSDMVGSGFLNDAFSVAEGKIIL